MSYSEALQYKKDWQKAQRARLKDGCDADSFVYTHIRESDGAPFYVGIGSSANRPWLLNHHSRTKFHKNVVKKHGVRVEIIADSLTWAQACFWEMRWIRALRATGYTLVNQTDGGDGTKGFTHSGFWAGKTKKKHPRYGASQSENTKHLLRVINTGKKHSDESIVKMRIANRGNKNGMYGKTHTEEVRDKLRKHFRKLLDTEVLEILNSKEKITKLMSNYGVCRKTIYNIKRGIAYNDVYTYWLSIKKDG